MPVRPPTHRPRPRERKAWDKGANPPKRLTGRALQQRNAGIALRDGYRCYVCGRITADGEVDHKQPLSRGGTDDGDNLGWICRTPCHEAKSRRERGQGPARRRVGDDGYPVAHGGNRVQ